jgi:hypothetical protein
LNSTNYFANPFRDVEPLLGDAEKALSQVGTLLVKLEAKDASNPATQLVKDALASTQTVTNPHFFVNLQ